MLYLPTKALLVSGVSAVQAVKIHAALAFGIWSLLLFWFLVLWRCRVTDAVVFTLLGQVSASAMFWSSVPESFVLGSATIIAALIFTIWPMRMNPLLRYTLAIAVSVSMTITNAMVGIFAAARRLCTKDLLIAGVAAWLIVTVLWVVQKGLFPAAVYFFPPGGRFISDFSSQFSGARVGNVLQALFSHTIVMPEVQIIPGPSLHGPDFETADRVLSVQRSRAGSGGFSGAIATMAWFGLVGLGAWAAWVARSGISLLCLLALAGQTALHIVFGPETFLFTMHVLPLLVVFVAGVTFTPLRPIGLALAVVVIVAGGLNNWAQFDKAITFVQELDAYARTFPPREPN
jgi:hypothetical protein